MLSRKFIGLAMRVYRASPLHPRMGAVLAKVLAKVAPRPTGLVRAQVGECAYELDLGEVIESSLYYSGSFEPRAERIIRDHVHPGATCLDVGANFGYHTFPLARLVGPSGRVVALEPMAQAFAKLQRNAALNDLTNLTLLQTAVGAEANPACEVRFQSSYRLDGGRVDEVQVVEVVTLDALPERLGLERLDFAKIDVDGFEGRVFAGAQRTFERFRPTLLFEIVPSAMRDLGDDPLGLLRQLTALGYRLAADSGQPFDTPEACLASVPPTGGNLLARIPL